MDYLANFIIWSLAVFGTTNIITVSALLKPFRDWIQFKEIIKDETGKITGVTSRKWALPGKLVNCPMCVGFWAGMFWSIMEYSPAYNLILESTRSNFYTQTLFDAFLGSITSWMLYLWIGNRQFGK